MSEKDEMDIAVTAIRRSAAVATRETIGNYAMGQDLGGDLEKDIDKEYNRIASLAFSPLENPIKLINGMSPTLLKTPLYIKKRPVAGAVASQMSFIEPEHLAYIRRTARGIYKNVVFMRGHGIKEGSKKYPISLFLGAEKDVSYATALAEHKDAWKANMMYRIYRPGFLKNPKTLNYQFVTSKGFHSLVLGSKQRRKGHRAKRASKRAGKAARKALKK